MTLSFLDATKHEILVCDGAMGTELMKRGLEPGSCPELWNVEHADALASIHEAYREAGSRLSITNTFGGNRWKLDAYGLGARTAELNSAAVMAARKGADKATFVAGDIGPTGRFMAPLGTDLREAFVEVFREQASALAGAGADCLALETFTALDELLSAVEASKSTGLPVIASMSYSRTADGVFRTMMGNDLASSTAALEAAGADVIAANCGTGPKDYVDIARALCAANALPVMIEPNAGMPQLVAGKTVFPMSAEEVAAFIPDILSAGVRIIGGCCGTTPEHIRLISDIVRKQAS